LAQKWAEPDAALDLQRIATFTFFCVGYVGSFQHLLFSRVYPRLFPGEGMAVAVKKVSKGTFPPSLAVLAPLHLPMPYFSTLLSPPPPSFSLS
jgi:hypothetical protein